MSNALRRRGGGRPLVTPVLARLTKRTRIQRSLGGREQSIMYPISPGQLVEKTKHGLSSDVVIGRCEPRHLRVLPLLRQVSTVLRIRCVTYQCMGAKGRAKGSADYGLPC